MKVAERTFSQLLVSFKRVSALKKISIVAIWMKFQVLPNAEVT